MPSLAKLLPFSSLLAAVVAVPNVTVVPLTGTCADYPGYDASTGISDTFIMQLNSCDNSTIEGFGDTCQVIRHAGDTGIHEGRISIAADDMIAKTAFRCNSATGAGVLEGLTPSGVSGYAWNQMNLTYLPWDQELGWGFGQYSVPIEAYGHLDETGAAVAGIFLGSGNVTTWGVKLYPADAGSLDGNPYWGLRLLGPDSAIPETNSSLYDGEYRTFLTVYV